ncbi:YfhD family protein [Virgibacillus soli]|uniref:YfhD family protein n=1 Tax=Paracerasibacillus soli TaxID=480284 RepID=A0ABU5CVC5_9BACI|nr:YfhD family protein [Virgibacillus soli]MDY0410327.1 YfhD family protein [Virgibacillus soli]
MGRDEHRKSRGKRHLAQTPKNQLSDGLDIEFSEELADDDDKEAQNRSKAADRRVKQQRKTL